MTEVVLPIHTNSLGTIFGGQIMAWMDIAGAAAAIRHSRSICVTASIDALNFLNPVRVSSIVTILASVNYTGRTSMEVGVRVDGEEPLSGKRTHVASAYLTFVAIDGHGRPTPVPAVVPETAEEKRRWRGAQLRRQSRLKLKQQLAKKEPSE